MDVGSWHLAPVPLLHHAFPCPATFVLLASLMSSSLSVNLSEKLRSDLFCFWVWCMIVSVGYGGRGTGYALFGYMFLFY
jgi:hypothetical protein